MIFSISEIEIFFLQPISIKGNITLYSEVDIESIAIVAKSYIFCNSSTVKTVLVLIGLTTIF